MTPHLSSQLLNDPDLPLRLADSHFLSSKLINFSDEDFGKLVMGYD